MNIRLIRWERDGEPMDDAEVIGYNVHDYFGDDGKFLGPDQYGIYPVYEEEGRE